MAVHLFPFSVNQDCSINAETYLHISPETRQEHQHKSLTTLQTVVRGRRLVGLDVKLPDTVQGKYHHPIHDPSTRDLLI